MPTLDTKRTRVESAFDSHRHVGKRHPGTWEQEGTGTEHRRQAPATSGGKTSVSLAADGGIVSRSGSLVGGWRKEGVCQLWKAR
ncbi:transducin beta-like protein 2-like isoform 2 [Anopheles sinensis]|uniref:Transducin beta-like protein 2-like isoform 2 n=1 Tax=Anopheles sinensis TaxID=74873 RepID=A0A084WE22_ANOSI|nr:transducin beta-like protein 2-like isoform 2 [Anopheles sinensis]